MNDLGDKYKEEEEWLPTADFSEKVKRTSVSTNSVLNIQIFSLPMREIVEFHFAYKFF